MKRIFNFQFSIFNSRGFTLVELVVVITVMAILVSGILFLIDPLTQFKKGRDSQRKSDLRQIQSALEMYRSDHGEYPSSIPNCPPSIGVIPDCNTTTYMKTVPNDPSGGSYQYSTNGTIYCLRACLENANDSQKDSPNNPVITGCTLSNCTTSYTLQNP